MSTEGLLRTQLVETTLAWEQTYGIAPQVTSALSEYDAAMLVGCSEAEYIASLQGRTVVSKGYDFEYNRKRYQVKANRPSGKPGSRVTLVAKAQNYDWDVLVWFLYDRLYSIQEAWLWDVQSYKSTFGEKKRLSPKEMRCGHCLISRIQPILSTLEDGRKRAVTQLNYSPSERKGILNNFLNGTLKNQSVHYTKSRLYLDRKAIEQLSSAKPYLIIEIEPTPKDAARMNEPGYYVLDWKEFQTLFGKHTLTKSWETKKCFHFPKPPQKAADLFIERS